MRKTSILLILTAFFSACGKSQDALPVQKPNRIIEFSGYKWLVRNSDDQKKGPGPNYFSNSKENVWLDKDGRLHLKIVKKEGKWYCSGVTLRRSHGFSKYGFKYLDAVKKVMNGSFDSYSDK